MVKKNLEWLMRRYGLNPNALAKAARANQPTLFRILSGEVEDPRSKTLEPIAAFFGVSVETLRSVDLEQHPELLNGDGPFAPGSATSEPSNLGKPPRMGAIWNNEDELDDSEYVFAPRMDMSVPCGDGKPMFHIEEKGQRQAFRKAYIERVGANPSTIATVTAEGNSMAPRIQDDDSLAIDYSQNYVRDDTVFVFTYGEDWYIKRLFRKPGGGLRIVSDNPDKAKYPDWHIEPEQMSEFRAIAKVIALSGRVD